MADLAFGLSKTAIELLADKFNKAIKEDAEQWQTVERDLVFITGEFEMMQSFLDTATEEHVKNKIVRTWVRQVRNLSYDVEDCIDFIVQILDTTKRSSLWLRLLPSCGKTGELLPVDEAVAQTTLLRARVVDVSKRNIRYNLIVDSASRPMAAKDLVPVQKTAAGSSVDILVDAIKKSGPLDLAGLICREDRDLQVVSFCETEGDLVQVAIVRKAYSDARICKEFACRAWVKLMHPFNPLEFIQSLMTQFLAHSCQEQVNIGPHELEMIGTYDLQMMLQGTQADLIEKFALKEYKHRYLIVLEDLSSLAQWDAIRSFLPDRKKGSRIVVLTHHAVIASQCTGEPCRVSELDQFSPGHSVHVYYKELQSLHIDRSVTFAILQRSAVPIQIDLYGRENEMDELFEKIEKTKEMRLISVWGMPGVGKSALVKAMYYGKLRTRNQFKRYRWVTVSHPFNAESFYSGLVNVEGEPYSFGEVHGESRLSDRDCLVVIDNLQSNEDWDWIKSNMIRDGDSRSYIIIITSEESVAKHCAVSIDGLYNVKGLHATAANELFEEVLEEKGRLKEYKQVEEAKHLLSMCGGLPAVIIDMATYTASKPRDVLALEMRRLSDNFLHELSTNPEFGSLRCLHASMLSYWDSSPQAVKKCLLYLLIFPQDTVIGRRRLIKRWIAEGYFNGPDPDSMEKYAEKILDEVVAQGIMQPVREASKVTGFLVNGLFREYIVSRPVEETIFFPVQVSVLEEKRRGHLTTEGIGQHLAIGSSWEDDKVVYESLDLSRLRSLTVFNRLFSSFYVSGMMRVLRVLDLENAEGVNDSHFEEIVKLPSRLKFLSLRGQSHIRKLPESVGDLLQLQTMDIRGTSIRTLPAFITKLRKLQYIRAGTTDAWTEDGINNLSDDADEGSTPPSTCSWTSNLASCLPNKFLCRVVGGSRSGGVEVPRGITRLKALQTLGAVCINTLFTAEVIEVLGSIPNLRILHLHVNKDQDVELKFLTHIFRRLQELEIACKSKLHVRFGKGAMEKLEHLKVHCLQGSEVQFSGLEHPVNLKLAWLLGSFNVALKEAVQQQLAKHPKKPALKLEVLCHVHPRRRDPDCSICTCPRLSGTNSCSP